MNSKNQPSGFIGLVAAGILCCSFGVGSSPSTHPVAPISIELQQTGKDSSQVKQTILGFLQWYKTNIGKANSIKVLGYDSRGYQVVDKKGSNNYLSFIKSSGFVSDKYIAYWKKYFDDKAVQLRNEKLTKDDVPEGFDFDLVLITQEPELVLDKLDSLQFKIVSLNKTKAVILVSLPSDDRVMYNFEMQKYPSGWQIDYIATENYD